MIYHVSKNGSDRNDGSENAPFLTVQRAANAAWAGDEVVVHGGVYREWVDPLRGGRNDSERITYRAAEGERAVLKGSEPVPDWTRVRGDVWMAEIPNALFGDFNPFAEKVRGDWLVDPSKYDVHLGAVYLDGAALFEARSEEELFAPALREWTDLATWWGRPERILRPEESLRVWRAEVRPDVTVIRANFGGADPNEASVEVNVRPCCFFPRRNGVDFITVRGFEMCHAATQWAPPTGIQTGMVGPNWAKGWIIEDNLLHDSKCSAISLGWDGFGGDSTYLHDRKKPDYLYQMEAVFRALTRGWSRERIGSHIVRRNTIRDCGQTGIVGHMGCVFSEIYDNDISYIATRHEFWGHEIAGIKLHAAIDVQIRHNRIHHCSLGVWLDWQAQGTRVSRSVFDHNARDLMIEVTHGPHLVDNNIFASPYTLDNAAEGGAFVHNLCCGLTNHYPVLDRPTPYHMPHSTEAAGVIWTAGMDDRWVQNVFVGGSEPGKHYGTDSYNGASRSLDEFRERQASYTRDYLAGYRDWIQPAYIQRNVYLNGSAPWEHETDAKVCTDFDPCVSVEDAERGPVLRVTLPETLPGEGNTLVTTALLGAPRVTGALYENPDGSPLTVDRDLLGQTLPETPLPGPIQGLRPGENVVPLGQFGANSLL